MNSWQVCKQLKNLLEVETWDDGDQDVVFGKVLVSMWPTEEASASLVFPFCLIAPLGGRVDEQEENLVEQTFEVRVVTRVLGDPWGETVLIGGPRSGGQGGSQGRGLMELEEKVFDACVNLDQTNGIALRLDTTEPVEVALDDAHGYLASRAYRLTAWCTIDRSYPAPTRVTATDSSGVVTIAWTLPPSRYDRTAVIVRRASGSTAPSSVTSGTGVTVGATDTSVTDAPGTGTWTYAVFESYDDLGSGTADRWSSGASATVSSTWTPLALQSALEAWWDASDSDTITSDVNGVSQWSDKSGNGHDLVQASNDLKPTVASAAFNGLDALLFDGVDDLLTAATAPVTGPEFWVFLVAAHTGNTGSSPFSLYGSPTAQNYYFQRVNVAKNWLWVVNSGTYAQTSTSDTNGQAVLVVAHESSSTSRTIELDGAGTGTDSTSATPSGITGVDVGKLRSNFPLNGHVMEIVVASGSLTATQLSNAETYFERWGMTIP